MSLKFVTRKLKTQKLEEQEQQQKLSDKIKHDQENLLPQSAIDGANNDDSDSGTESDEEDDCKGIKSGLMTVDHTFVPYATPSEDNYSSEEELKEIINEQETSLKKKSPSKKEKSLSSLAKNEKKSSSASSSSGPGSSSRAPSASEGGLNNNKIASTASVAVSTTSSNAAAEKRKWSEVISDDDLGDLEEEEGLELEMTSSSRSSSQRSSRLYVRSSGANTTASSSCSNEDPETGCVCGRRLTTPVQFCTSPPMDVHRPRRKPWTPPPPKVFHVMASSHSASFDLTQEEDDEIVDIENRARPRQAAFMPVNTTTGNGNASICNNGDTAMGMGHMTMQGTSSDEQTTSAMTTMTTNASQYCPRHHHHTQQQQQHQQRQTPSPNKRHRLTPRPHNIQRPCLDFEKMQQIKKRVVTSWRPQGAELSLFCW